MMLRRVIFSIMGVMLAVYTMCAASLDTAIQHADHIADKDFKHWFIYATIALFALLAGAVYIMWGQGIKVINKLIELIENSHELTGKTNQILEDVKLVMRETRETVSKCRDKG